MRLPLFYPCFRPPTSGPFPSRCKRFVNRHSRHPAPVLSFLHKADTSFICMKWNDAGLDSAISLHPHPQGHTVVYLVKFNTLRSLTTGPRQLCGAATANVYWVLAGPTRPHKALFHLILIVTLLLLFPSCGIEAGSVHVACPRPRRVPIGEVRVWTWAVWLQVVYTTRCCERGKVGDV